MYKIEFEKKALKFLQKLPQKQRERIFEAIRGLPHSGDIKVMQGVKGYFRLRVGDFRVIYSVDHGRLIVLVVEIGNRGDIYK